tara:strand:+ start:514 stop:804 length:291 start_codon:yes stop_codon:yes gene_type:complete
LIIDSELKVPGGKLIKVRLEIQGNYIQTILLTGDFFLHPEDAIFEVESSLIGSSTDLANIKEKLEKALKKKDARLLGVSPDDFINVIKKALDQAVS